MDSDKKNTKIIELYDYLSLSDEELLQRLDPAIETLQCYGTVVMPTETVYGLAANAMSPQAIREVFIAKGRPADNPLITHISDLEMFQELAMNIHADAMAIARTMWPGPITLIVQKDERMNSVVSAGLPTIAVRMPDHRVAQTLIKACHFPLAAPSANRSGAPSTTTAKHVKKDMMGRADLMILSEDSSIGIESTVLDCTVTPPVVLRPGFYTIEDIEKIAGVQAREADFMDLGSPKSPGLKYKHYAPEAELFLYEPTATSVKIVAPYDRWYGEFPKIGVLFFEGERDHIETFFNESKTSHEYVYISAGDRRDVKSYAAKIYKVFRTLDEQGCALILAPTVEEKGIGKAIMNRLNKACSYN